MNLTYYFAALVGYITMHPFLFAGVYFAVIALVAGIYEKKKITGEITERILRLFKGLSGIFFLLYFPVIFINFFLGETIFKKVVNTVGVETSAIVGKVYRTSTIYNHRRLYEYEVYIQTEGGKNEKVIVDDMYVPYVGKYADIFHSYPETGEKVIVKYIPGFPRFFVILTERITPYIARVLCNYGWTNYNEKKKLFDSMPNEETAKEYKNVLITLLQDTCGSEFNTYLNIEMARVDTFFQRGKYIDEQKFMQDQLINTMLVK